MIPTGKVEMTAEPSGSTRGRGFTATLRYRLKRLVEGSLPRQLMVLGILSAVVIGVFALLFNALQTEFGHGGNLWFSIISMFSSDSLFEVETQSSVVKTLVLILSSIGIVVFNGILIAIIIGSLMNHLDELKKGHGEVREKGHIVLLGRSEFIPHILDELDAHCRVERRRSMKVAVMRSALREDDDLVFRSRPRIDVIPRLGGAWSTDALERLSIRDAKGVVVFGGDPGSGDGLRFNDALVTKTLVSINSLIGSLPRGTGGPSLVLNYNDSARAGYARDYLERSSPGLMPVFFDPVFYTAKLISCLCANPHAYSIYNELLTAEGSEFHEVTPPVPPGTRFGDLALRFPKGIPVGYRKNRCVLAPDPDTPLPENASIIVLAPSSRAALEMDPAESCEPCIPVPELPEQPTGDGILFIGTNDKLPRIVEEMHRQRRRRLLVLDNQSEDAFRKWYTERTDAGDPEPPEFRECHFRSVEALDRVFPGKEIETVILLADGFLAGTASPDQIDADTFSRLLMAQHLLSTRRNHEVHMIVEILTTDTEAVVREFRRCSHIVGPLVIGRLLTTFALYPHMEEVFRRLIRTGDVDLVCTPLEEIRSRTGFPGGPVFRDLILRAPKRSVPLGWVDPSNRPGVLLNPSKQAVVPDQAQVIYLSRAPDG